VRAPTFLPDCLPMSPSQAAQATGVSRRTVMRAVETGELEAFRDNRNHWKILPQDIQQWASAHVAPSVQDPFIAQVEQAQAHTPSIFEMEIEELKLERDARRLAEVEAAELRGKLIATEAERDRLHNIIQNFTTRRRRWWLF